MTINAHLVLIALAIIFFILQGFQVGGIGRPPRALSWWAFGVACLIAAGGIGLGIR